MKEEAKWIQEFPIEKPDVTSQNTKSNLYNFCWVRNSEGEQVSSLIISRQQFMCKKLLGTFN